MRKETYVFKPFGGEIEDCKISDDVKKLKGYIGSTWGRCIYQQISDFILVSKNGDEIGVIGKVEIL